MQRRKAPSVPFVFPDWLEVSAVSGAVIDALTKHARGKVLDIGCGEKPYERLGEPIESWIGFDVASNPNADVHGDASALPFEDDSFDTVLCTQVLEHVPEPLAVLSEISRALKPGGLLILTAPQYWELHEEPHDYYRYTYYGLKHLVTRAGMTVVEHTTQGQGAALGIQSLNLAIQHAGDKSKIGASLPVRIAKLPLYAALNIIALVAQTAFRNKRDVMNHLIVARA